MYKPHQRPNLVRYLRYYFMPRRGITPLLASNASQTLQDEINRDYRNDRRISMLGIMKGKPAIFSITCEPLQDGATVTLYSRYDNGSIVTEEVFIIDTEGCHYTFRDGKGIAPTLTVTWGEIFAQSPRQTSSRQESLRE